MSKQSQRSAVDVLLERRARAATTTPPPPRAPRRRACRRSPAVAEQPQRALRGAPASPYGTTSAPRPAKHSATPQRSVTHDRRARRRRLGRDHAEVLVAATAARRRPRPRRRPAAPVAAAARRNERGRRRRADRGARAAPCRRRARRRDRRSATCTPGSCVAMLHEQLEPFPVRDPADVEHDGRRRRRCRCARAACAARRAERTSGNPCGRTTIRSSAMPAARYSRASTLDAATSSVAPGMTPRKTVASRARFRSTLRCFGATMPDPLEDVRDAAEPAPRRDAGADRVAEPEDVHDVRARRALEIARQRRRQPHPAEVQRRREVVNAHAVDVLDARARRTVRVVRRQARREHLDRVAARREPLGEAHHHRDRPAERMRGPVRRHGEMDA